MNERPKIIYILVVLWTTIGILFIGTVIQRTFGFLDYLNMRSTFEWNHFESTVTFMYVLFIILYIVIISISFILAYESFVKKSQSWLLGIILTSFLMYFIFQAIYYIGVALITESFGQILYSFEYVVYILMVFFVPCLFYILTRPTVKTYFVKT